MTTAITDFQVYTTDIDDMAINAENADVSEYVTVIFDALLINTTLDDSL